jgi:O-methyltransferase involved in polyketide biosynthesis
MEEGRPSATAMVAAIQRAEHLLWDDAPKIFQDPLALGLSGITSASALQARLGVVQAEQACQSTPEVAQVNYRCARAGIVVRQRYAEDALNEAVERGVGQYVILGAGSILLPIDDETSPRSCASSRWTTPPRNSGSVPAYATYTSRSPAI